MRPRIARALLAPLLACAASATGCATATDENPFGGPPDATDEAAPPPHADAGLPSPDALVFTGDAGDDGNVTPDDAPPPVDAYDGAAFANPCDSHPDGYNWFSPDPNARCCHGQPMHVADFTSDTDCGACGIHCNTANSESCQVLGGRYFCRGCVASAACWSKCCSTSFTPYSCAASDCAGNCSSMYCPAGTHCVPGAPNSSDYCAY
jgi:hypothetical protein